MLVPRLLSSRGGRRVGLPEIVTNNDAASVLVRHTRRSLGRAYKGQKLERRNYFCTKRAATSQRNTAQFELDVVRMAATESCYPNLLKQQDLMWTSHFTGPMQGLDLELLRSNQMTTPPAASRSRLRSYQLRNCYQLPKTAYRSIQSHWLRRGTAASGGELPRVTAATVAVAITGFQTCVPTHATGHLERQR